VSLAVVTGGGQGLGQEIARAFAAAGYTVAVTGRTPEPLRALATERGGHAVPCDAGDRESVEALRDAVLARQRRVPVLPRVPAVHDPARVRLGRRDRIDDRPATLHGRTPYAASKTALTGLVRRLASPGGIARPRVEA
jgi:NAD(P)-dependent dehydrogenase (short-subunit alcohol dehydrogenase family)